MVEYRECKTAAPHKQEKHSSSLGTTCERIAAVGCLSRHTAGMSDTRLPVAV